MQGKLVHYGNLSTRDLFTSIVQCMLVSRTMDRSHASMISRHVNIEFYYFYTMKALAWIPSNLCGICLAVHKQPELASLARS